MRLPRPVQALARHVPMSYERRVMTLLPLLVINGLVLLLALQTYQPDIAAALASSDQHEREP